MTKSKRSKTVETLTHPDASRKNIPTVEHRSVMEDHDRRAIEVAYGRCNRDLDPQLVWHGKDDQGWSDLVVQAPPLYIQEKVHPKVLIDDLKRRSQANADDETGSQAEIFADFNGLPDGDARTEFYQHDANWSNRMVLGDSLQVMASLAEREGLRGKVQCIYLDPPYGIKFNSNFQWSTTSRDVKDGKKEHITREPEQVKAFRDTWRDGIHSYLTYLRDRLTVARDLLTESGSIFVQIGDENVHRVRAVMDEVFGEGNFVGLITFMKATAQTSKLLSTASDYLIWYARSKPETKYRTPLLSKIIGQTGATGYSNVETSDGTTSRRISQEERNNPKLISENEKVFALDHIRGTRAPNSSDLKGYAFQGIVFNFDGRYCWKTNKKGLDNLGRAGRLVIAGNQLSYKRYFHDFISYPMTTNWSDTAGASDKRYVVETSTKVIQRCVLMTTDPGDLVLDPTCGSGTTAYVAEQWGRRWITIDTSRVALALARARIMGARYPYYLLADSPEGQAKEAQISRKALSEKPTFGNIRQGFVYKRVPHITLKSIANNAEINVIWERWQETLEPLRAEMNAALGSTWEEWEVPREAMNPWPEAATKAWKQLQAAKTAPTRKRNLHKLNRALGRKYAFADVPEQPGDPWGPGGPVDAHRRWWEARIARQKEIDASIAAKANFEYLYDKPYEDKKKVRVSGPFTVESVSPHRVLGVDENDELIDKVAEPQAAYDTGQDFAGMVLENLKTAGVQQAHKEDKIEFSSVAPWPGRLVCAEGRYVEKSGGGGGKAVEIDHIQKRAGIFIGPEFGTVFRPDLVDAAKEAAEAGFNVLVTCAFSYGAHVSDFNKFGRIPILKARMNADLHMANDLKNTGKGNLFVIFGEPDIEILKADKAAGEPDHFQVKIKGVDVYHPNTGEIRSDNADGIACWFVDTDYNEESFFVRHAYFLGAKDPYRALKTTLKTEINQEAWATLTSDTSRPFPKPASGRIAVKVINHLGDEVMRVFRV